MTRFGVDLSDYDADRGTVDVAAMARDGITVLTHKATEGTSWQHVHYGPTLAAARAAGIPYLGAYVIPRTPGNGGAGTIQQQVDYALSYINAQTPWWPDHPGWFFQVDTEHWGYDQVAPSYGVLMCDLLEQATGRPVVHYAPRWAYGDSIGGDEPLWASAYGSNPATGYRQAYAAGGGDSGPGWTPYSGRTPLVWQFGSQTTIGSQAICDANAIRDEGAWQAFIGGDDMSWTDQIPVFRLDENGNAQPQDPPTLDAAHVLGYTNIAAWSALSAASAALDKLDALTAAVAALGDVRAALVAALADPTVVAALAAALPANVDEATVEAALRAALRSIPAS